MSKNRPLAQVVMVIWLTALACGAAQAASAKRSGEAEAPAAQQIDKFMDEGGPCHSERVQEAITLIYKENNVGAAAELALRCETLPSQQVNPAHKVMASRIRALIALRVRDMVSLKRAGETLVAQAARPEYVADGHFFIAFACVFGGDTKCARTHVDTAKTLFTQLKVAHALDQIKPLEQSLIELETSPF
ncbi:MAG: hypothetical protein Q7U28_06020 [Aquabacterium sp.]|nr:hypothetical protein [Aquabacterium sp.]